MIAYAATIWTSQLPHDQLPVHQPTTTSTSMYFLHHTNRIQVRKNLTDNF